MPPQQFQREPEQNAGRYVDYEGPVRKPGSKPSGYRRADPVPRQCAERASHGDIQIFLQCIFSHARAHTKAAACASLSKLKCCAEILTDATPPTGFPARSHHLPIGITRKGSG